MCRLLLVIAVLWVAPPTDARPTKPPAPTVLEQNVPRPSWRPRKRKMPKHTPKGKGLIDWSMWPPEPSSPEVLDRDRFAEAIAEACGWMPKHRPALYAEIIDRWATHFNVDPMLMAALMVDQSGCRPKARGEYGQGLTQIDVWMHQGRIKDRVYHYAVFDGQKWEPRTLPLKDYLFYNRALRQAESSMYFTAAFLKIFEEQAPALGHAFGSIEHRHFVSHFIWGDRVRGRGAEDRVLTARRRLIQYYRDEPSPARGRYKSLALQLPVDGAPRKITSDMGDPRGGGKRRHKGVDFDGPRGEPVRAVADGVIEFAGVDLKRGTSKLLTPKESKSFDKKLMGNGGFMVIIRHDEGLTSAYMHLDDYNVTRGQAVKRGVLIGHVGRTGISESPAHLHFEFRADGRHLDPMPLFGDLVFKPVDTYRGRRLDYEEHRKRRRR